MTDQIENTTAIAEPEHLKRWLRETGRTFIVFRSDDLIDGLLWPDGVNVFKQLVAAYRDHRRGIPLEFSPCYLSHAGAAQPCPVCNNKGVVVRKSKDDRLTRAERQLLREWLDRQDANETPEEMG